MNICRFSSEDWRSDVYCYQHARGHFVTRVATHRLCDALPPLLPAHTATAEQELAQLQRVRREQIALAQAGEVYLDRTPDALALRLVALRSLGFRVPGAALARCIRRRPPVIGRRAA